MKSPLDPSRRKRRKHSSAWARGEIRRKKRLVEKDSPGKKDGKNDHDVKTTEEELDEADSFRMEDEEKSEPDVSGQSLGNSAEGEKLLKGASEAEEKAVQVRGST